MSAAPADPSAPSGSACVALSGGVGGAKLAFGLMRLLPPERLTVVGNTGDDFEHLGLHVSPDLDTVMYTLAGVANRETGWGREAESWSFLEALDELGGETWFRIGDRDLAVHVERTRRLAAGESLSAVTAALSRALGVGPTIVPMSDDPVRTVVHTATGELAFQHYFVRHRCRPAVTGFSFAGLESARPSHGLLQALARPDLGAVVICPSNPFVSVEPILALDGIGEVLRRGRAPVVAVSPIVGGEAIKGPAAKMMRELALPCSAVAVARHYLERGRLDGFVLDRADAELAAEVESLGSAVLVTSTIMGSDEDRVRLATEVLELAARLGPAVEGGEGGHGA